MCCRLSKKARLIREVNVCSLARGDSAWRGTMHFGGGVDAKLVHRYTYRAGDHPLATHELSNEITQGHKHRQQKAQMSRDPIHATSTKGYNNSVRVVCYHCNGCNTCRRHRQPRLSVRNRRINFSRQILRNFFHTPSHPADHPDSI